MRLIRHPDGFRTGLFGLVLCLAGVACVTPPPIPDEPPPVEIPAAATPSPAVPAVPEQPATAPEEFKIAAVGDIMLGGTATPELRKYGYDYPFELTAPILKQAQIVFGNLEGPLTAGGTSETDKQYVFRSPPDKVAPALARAGFNIVSLANNHILDYGPQGLEDTRAALDRAGIRAVGAGRNLNEARAPAIMMAEGITVAFLAYSLTFPEEFWAGPDTPGTAFGHERHVREDVAAARQRADIVVVSFHWGTEGKTELRDYQITLARAAIDAGASVVLGHHPHILQAVERYRQGAILYSLGNFVFGSYSRIATRSMISLITFRDKQLREIRLIPINVNNPEVVFQPKPLSGQDAVEAMALVQQLSLTRGTDLEYRDDSAILTLGEERGN